VTWTAKYIGLPFKDHGRDWDGVDCWGLVRLILWHERKIEIPSYGDTSALDLANVAGLMKVKSIAEPWVNVIPAAAHEFDVVVMHHRRDPIHVGIMASSTHMMHIEEKISAVLLPITHPTIRFRYPKYFRHRQLLDHAA
jgi:cell wall-associated NlpC family hydrolase